MPGGLQSLQVSKSDAIVSSELMSRFSLEEVGKHENIPSSVERILYRHSRAVDSKSEMIPGCCGLFKKLDHEDLQ